MGRFDLSIWWTDALGTSATITTIGQFLSGFFTVHKIIVKQGGTVGDLSSVPFLMGAVGCALWLIYGYIREDANLIRCNIVGTVLNAFYVLVFMRYTIIKSVITRQVTCALVFLSMVILYVHNGISNNLESIREDATSPIMRNVGLLCIVISLLGCASPLVALKEVLRTKSTEVLPFPLIFSMFLVCTQWWGYGVLTDDPYMEFTNFLGSCIALVQLGLFCVYPTKPSGGNYKKLHTIT